MRASLRRVNRRAPKLFAAIALGLVGTLGGITQVTAPVAANVASDDVKFDDVGFEETTPQDEQETTSPTPVPRAVNSQFASQNLNRYFSLVAPNNSNADASTGEHNGSPPAVNSWQVHIRYVHMNGASTALANAGLQANPKWLAVKLQVGPGRTNPKGYNQTVKRNPNALGVTEEGVFFFTQQYRQALTSDANSPNHEYVDVWRYESGSPTGIGTVLTRIVSGLDLGPTITGNPQQIVAGEYNPYDKAFYFGFYRPVAPDGATAPDGQIAMHLFRAEQAGGTWTAGQIGTALTPNGTYLAGTNGDFVFDNGGNLTFLVSDQGTLADAYIGTIPTNELRDASVTQPSVFEDFAISNKMQFATGANGGQANGIIFTRSGRLVVQASLNQRMIDPTTFAETSRLDNLDVSGEGAVLTTDLAGFASPPTVAVVKDVVGRRDPSDQFRLRAGASESQFQSVITRGVGADPTATGEQSRVLGPIGVYQGSTVVIGEDMARESVTVDAGQYNPTFSCTNLNSGDPVELAGEPGSTTRSLVVPMVGAAEWQGPQVRCVITNDGRMPKLEVSKLASPDSGESVKQGDEVTYRLNFDNTEGFADATDVVYTDYLADVLDDADFVDGSLTVMDVTDPDNPAEVTTGFNAQFDPHSQAIVLTDDAGESATATVPAGRNYQVSYSVKVKDNLDDDGNPRASEGDNTAFALKNFVVEGDGEAPEKCEVPAEGAAPLCTEHPVRSWTASKKDSLPAHGATLHAGGNVYYSLEVKKGDPSYAVDDIVVTDDLTDVLKLAEWDAAAPDLSAQGAATRGIYFFDGGGNPLPNLTINKDQLPAGTTLDDWVPGPQPVGGAWKLKTAAFDLPVGAASAQVWFAVRIKSPLAEPAGSSFTNTYSAKAGPNEPPANECRTGVNAGEPGGHREACEVTHFVGEDYFTVRKDGRGTLADGTTQNLTDLIGHEFELRVDQNGTMGEEVPSFMCSDWNQAPSADETCGRFYPIPSGAQAGRWRADNIEPGTYWLLETKAPNAQRLDESTTRPVTGVQLLAEPVKFRVASRDDAGAEAPGVPDKKIVAGQIDMVADDGSLQDRCDTDGDSQRPTACVNPTGYLMAVNDPGLIPLPLSGGSGVNVLTLGAVLMILGGGIAAYLWRRQRDRELTSL